MADLTGDVLTAVMKATSTSHDAVVHMLSQTRGVNRAFRDAVSSTRQNPAWTADIQRRGKLFRCAMEPDGDVNSVQVGYENYGIEQLLSQPTYDALVVRMREFFADEWTQGCILSRLARDLLYPKVYDAVQQAIVQVRRNEVFRSGLLQCIAESMRLHLHNRQIQESGIVVLKCLHGVQRQPMPLNLVLQVPSLQLCKYVVGSIAAAIHENLHNMSLVNQGARTVRCILAVFLKNSDALLPPQELLDLRLSLMAPPRPGHRSLPNLIVAMLAQDTNDEKLKDNCICSLKNCYRVIQMTGVHGALIPLNALTALPVLLRCLSRCKYQVHRTTVAVKLIKWCFTQHFESMRAHAPRLCRQILQSLVNLMPALSRDAFYNRKAIKFVSKIMFQMQHLEPDPEQVLFFQNFVYDTGVVSLYLAILLRELPDQHQKVCAIYISVVTRLCHNNPRTHDLVQRLEIVPALDFFWEETACDEQLQNNRAALDAMLYPVLPTDGHGAPS